MTSTGNLDRNTGHGHAADGVGHDRTADLWMAFSLGEPA